MKKLLLLLSLLLATNAWGETKFLTCEIEEEAETESGLFRLIIEIAFDLELKNFEINLESSDESEGPELDPTGVLSIFPTFLSFLFKADDDFYKLVLNREDLIANLIRVQEAEYMTDRIVFESFKCQLVRGRKNQI